MPLDRLSTLFARFDLVAEPLPPARFGDGNLFLLATERENPPEGLLFWPDPDKRSTDLSDVDRSSIVLAARIDLGAAARPLTASLPDRLYLDIAAAPQIQALTTLMSGEAEVPRCGGGTAFTRLCEVLLIQMLRHAIEHDLVRSGMLAGLAHPQLARAVVALHDDPARAWNVEALAAQAGMSRSRFMATFQQVMAETPMRYLKRWRMQAARRDLSRGGRVGATARRYGYASAEAFSRAYLAFFGEAPSTARRKMDGLPAS